MNPKKKPKFLRQGAKSLKRLGEKWRATKGKQNKLRQHQKSKGNYPNPGYGSPSSLRSLHPSGYQEIMIRNVKDLENITEKQAGRIASTVGRKKRMQMMKIAEERKIKILNPLKQEAVK